MGVERLTGPRPLPGEPIELTAVTEEWEPDRLGSFARLIVLCVVAGFALALVGVTFGIWAGSRMGEWLG